jgi:hypothetical protein
VTQNVKNARASARLGAISALVLVGLGTLSVGGCSSDTEKPPTMSTGRFTSCEASTECDQAHGFSCVDGECTYECATHTDCVEVGHCRTQSLDGARRRFCVRDATPPTPGELYTACPLGTECKDAALCLGAGPGDLDAYCSIDCSKDSDCAAGYSCSTLVRNPCEDACNDTGSPSDPRCVPADQIGEGKPFHCGDLGVERNVCRQREFCSTCETDADCLAVPNQVCAKDKSGEKICTKLCDTSARSCPWGNAAECDVFDQELGVPTCSHRFGSCHGEGRTCEPCRSNDDCPGGACASSPFTGERWCVNLDTHCECKKGVDASGTCSNGGCPDSPSGLPIQCVGTRESSLFNICYAANSGTDSLLDSSPQTGCWDAP